MTGLARIPPVRVIDVFVDELDLGELGFSGGNPKVTDQPSYHSSCLLKLYIYGYQERSSRTTMAASAVHVSQTDFPTSGTNGARQVGCITMRAPTGVSMRQWISLPL